MIAKAVIWKVRLLQSTLEILGTYSGLPNKRTPLKRCQNLQIQPIKRPLCKRILLNMRAIYHSKVCIIKDRTGSLRLVFESIDTGFKW